RIHRMHRARGRHHVGRPQPLGREAHEVVGYPDRIRAEHARNGHAGLRDPQRVQAAVLVSDSDLAHRANGALARLLSGKTWSGDRSNRPCGWTETRRRAMLAAWTPIFAPSPIASRSKTSCTDTAPPSIPRTMRSWTRSSCPTASETTRRPAGFAAR